MQLRNKLFVADFCGGAALHVAVGARSAFRCAGEAHSDGVESTVDVHDFAGNSSGEVGAQEGGGVADVFRCDIPAKRRDFRDLIQHLAKAGDACGGKRLDGTRGDPIYARTLGSEVGGQEAHIGLEAGLGEPHYVVAGYRADCAEIRESKKGAVATRHERAGTAGEGRKAVAGYVMRDAEGVARRVRNEAARDGIAGGKRHGVNDDIELTPFPLQQVKG